MERKSGVAAQRSERNAGVEPSPARAPAPPGRLAALLVLVLVVVLAAPPAFAAEVAVRAVVDRLEEDAWIVLDLPPHPSLPVPLRIAPGIREGDSVIVTISPSPFGAWKKRGREDRGVLFADRLGAFHWPESLAPPLRTGDRVTFVIVADPIATRARRDAFRTLPRPSN